MHGIHVHGFPNLFIIGFAQGANLISNVTSNLTDSGMTIAAVVRHALDDRCRRGRGQAEAEQAWMDLLGQQPRVVHRQPRLHARLLQQRGPAARRRARFVMAGYPLGPVAYFEYIDNWRNSGEFEGLEFRTR